MVRHELCPSGCRDKLRCLCGPGLKRPLLSDFRGEPEADRYLDQYRAKLVRTVFFFALTFGLLALFPSLFFASVAGAWLLVAVDLVAYGGVAYLYFNRDIPLNSQIIALLTITYGIGFAILASIHMFFALFWFFCVPILAALLSRLHLALASLAANAVILFVCAYWGNYHVGDWGTPLSRFGGWLLIEVNFLFLNTVLTLSVAYLVRSLRGGIAAQMDMVRELRAKQHELAGQIRESQRMQDELVRAKKMETLGTVVGGVAHDLNNILAGVINYPELLLMNLSESSDLREPVKAIMDSGLRAAEVVADMLTLVRNVAKARTRLDMEELAKGFIASPEFVELSNAHENVSVELACDQPVAVFCSRNHMFRSLYNLVSNAMEAAVPGRQMKICISVGRQESAGRAYGVLGVADNGCGISKADQEHIFEPFYSKKVMGRSGTGLGLTVVWNTVREHDGLVLVDSDASGTCFRMLLPLAEADAGEEAEEAEAGVVFGQGQRVLVVDDESVQRAVATELLNLSGYHADAVASGQAALDYLKTHLVDLVLLDMVMPGGLDGLETFERIRELEPEQKVLIISGYSDLERVRRMQHYGAGEFVEKPYTSARLLRAVADALALSPVPWYRHHRASKSHFVRYLHIELFA